MPVVRRAARATPPHFPEAASAVRLFVTAPFVENEESNARMRGGARLRRNVNGGPARTGARDELFELLHRPQDTVQADYGCRRGGRGHAAPLPRLRRLRGED